MIETSFKNSQNQNFKLYKSRGALLLGYAPLLGIIRYSKTMFDKTVSTIICVQWEHSFGVYHLVNVLVANTNYTPAPSNFVTN